MARILVTGGAGFLGCAVVQALAARGDHVAAVDLVSNPHLQQIAATHPGVSIYLGEVTEWARMAGLIQSERPDGIVHCAAIVGVPASVNAPFRTFQVNVEGSLNLMEAMRLFGVKRMVHISSEETYGPFLAPQATEDHPQKPVMPYGISKLAVELLGRSYRELYGLDCVHIRTCWVYGPDLPRPRVPKILVDAAIEGRPLHIEAGADFAVDHTHVDDVVQGILLALDKPNHAFEAYNIGSGSAPTLQQIIDIVKEHVPGAQLSIGKGPYRHPGGVPCVTKGALDITRARKELGYAPKYDIRRGIVEYITAVRAARSAAPLTRTL
jgi:UDP-glucose 4-epimerase